jgi:mono/diheme cytochrome c family protein
LERACADADSHVRCAAIQAATPLLREAAGQKLLNDIAARVATEDPMVLAHLALALGKATGSPAAREVLWNLLPRAAEHPSLADGLLIALRGEEGEVLRRLHARVVSERHLPFGGEALLENLAARIVLGGGSDSEALTAAICDKGIPQLGRLALMRGTTKVRGAGLSEPLLTRLAAAAPDAWVRRTAAESIATIKQRDATAARRPRSRPLTPPQQALFDAGKTTYGLCAACHQPDGLGRPDLAPSLSEGRWINAVSPDSAIRIVLHGKQGTPGFPAPMVPLPNLDDEKLAGVLTFVRRSFGNNAPAVDPADIARVRSETAARVTPWTDAELAAVSGEAKLP